MRLVYLSCILLGVIICTCRGNVVPSKGETQTTIRQIPEVTTAVPLKSTHATSSAVVSDASKTPNIIANPTPNSIPIINSSIVNVNVTNNDITTAFPMSSSAPTSAATTVTTAPVTKLTTKKVETTTEKITTSSVPASTTAKSSITTSPPSVTTAVPISTKEAPPSQSPDRERHFDGLSFIGGIILAACLMVIGIYSCKLYRSMKEGNYRTL